MTITVKLFASMREQAGAESIELAVAPEARVRDLLEALKETYPHIHPVSGRWAVNMDFAALDHRIHEDDDIAFIPPVSGG